MSPLDREVPPAGEEIHLPPGSMQPLMLTIGITAALVGITFSVILLVAGGLLALATIALWIRDARKEYSELPVHHADDHH